MNDPWKEVALKAGVCPSCALGAPDTFGCADCHNTGWAQGHPTGYRPMSDAAQDVLDERHRQITVEGWTADHDDWHSKGEIALAAACYAISGAIPKEERGNNDKLLAAIQFLWPRSWSWTWWKPTTLRRDLVKAAALLLAEIERLDRNLVSYSKETVADIVKRITDSELKATPWRHKKRGTTYTVLGVAKMQTGDWVNPYGNSVPVDGQEVVVYKSTEDGAMWVRPKYEFLDGRFEKCNER